jgi:predicted transcriptional regulator
MKWKLTRIKIFNLLNEGKSVKEISNKLHITDKAIYKNIDLGALKIIVNLFNQITFEINSKL